MKKSLKTLGNAFYDISPMLATQVESERLFSAAGLLFDEKNLILSLKKQKIFIYARFFKKLNYLAIVL